MRIERLFKSFLIVLKINCQFKTKKKIVMQCVIYSIHRNKMHDDHSKRAEMGEKVVKFYTVDKLVSC